MKSLITLSLDSRDQSAYTRWSQTASTTLIPSIYPHTILSTPTFSSIITCLSTLHKSISTSWSRSDRCWSRGISHTYTSTKGVSRCTHASWRRSWSTTSTNKVCVWASAETVTASQSSIITCFSAIYLTVSTDQHAIRWDPCVQRIA